MVVSYKAKFVLTVRPSDCTLEFYLRGMKTYVHAKACLQMFITGLFILAEN